MADQEQPGPKTTEQIAEKVQKIRSELYGALWNDEQARPAERALFQAVKGILDVLDDLSKGHDAGTY